MKELAESVNLQTSAGFMFSSPELKCPRPSCPNWFEPMLKTAPKVLTIRQQPFPQLTFLICLLARSKQGGSIRKLLTCSSSTVQLWSPFSPCTSYSGGQYISPHPATSPKASHMMAAFPREILVVACSFPSKEKGMNQSAVSVRPVYSPHSVYPRKYILRFFSLGPYEEGRGISLQSTIFSVLLVKPCQFHVQISYTDLPCLQGQMFTSTCFVSAGISMLSQYESLPC